MKKLAVSILITLTVLIASGVSAAQSTHNVWSEHKPIVLRDGATGASFSAFVDGNASFAWSPVTPRAFANARAKVTPALNYDFMLISITSLTGDMITGRWNIRRNGVLVCANCIGKAYGLSQPAAGGNYFKIYVGTPAMYAEKWHYGGYITSRFDF